MITVDFKKISIRPNDRILDIGCGTGRHTAAAYQQPEVSVIGADISHSDLQEARKRLCFHDRLGAHGRGRWTLLMANITALPFEDASFDVVICSEVLEHIHEDAGAIAEIIRVLKPGSILVVSVPRYFPERICWALSNAYHQTPGGHIRIYRNHRLQRLLKTGGIIPYLHHYAHSLHSPYWWLKCLAGHDREDVTLVNLYHRLLTWDILTKPRLTRFLDRLLNPVLGKSLVVYSQKPKGVLFQTVHSTMKKPEYF